LSPTALPSPPGERGLEKEAFAGERQSVIVLVCPCRSVPVLSKFPPSRRHSSPEPSTMEPALDRTETAGPQPQVAELLVVRARQGDARAFEELYRQHHRRIYALALRLTRDRGRAEELTQDAFVRAWEALAGFRGESSFATWMHGLTVRVFLSQARAEKRWAERFEASDDR